MREYYPIKINMNEAIHYMIWYTDEVDGFITELSKPLLFSSPEKLKLYAKNKGLQLEEDLASYDFGAIIKWIENPDTLPDCELILDSWNFFSDLSKSTGNPFKGNFDLGNTVDVYNKLFYGSNLSAIEKNGETYTSECDEKELLRLKIVLTDGLELMSQFTE